MMNWLKRYYSRKDTRVNFMLEDLKINLICVAAMAAVCYGYNKYLDWKDRQETERNIFKTVESNEELQAYVNEED